jgi:predicted metalloprotease with PDZ domain
MQFRLSSFVVLSLLIVGASAQAQEKSKCNVPARECEQQIRAMLNGKRYLGVLVEEMSPGLMVKSVVPESPADHAELKPGDRLMSVNGHETIKASIADFKKIISEVNSTGRLWIIVQRHGLLKKVDARMEPYTRAQIDKIVAQHLQDEHPAAVQAPSKQQ